eukprot:10732327-Karenia_brevis.AAC.1
MKGHTAFGEFWKDIHNALVDLVRQCGLPKLFWTMSPYEILAPYHEWVQDEMAKRFCHRMHLPAGEALHMAHCISQITSGLLAGSTGEAWTKHLLHTKSRRGRPLRVFMRMEYQDGTHKEGTKRYEGSGRPHIHVLVFGDDFDNTRLA